MRSIVVVRTALAVVGVTFFATSLVAGERSKDLTGARIRAKLTGMQLTDEVHYRFIYERDGTFRSYAMGVKKTGRWTVEGNELCLHLGEPDDGCYRVRLAGSRIEMIPSGLGGMIDGVLQAGNGN